MNKKAVSLTFFSLFFLSTMLLTLTKISVEGHPGIINADDYPTIQAAINTANPGDTISVSSGTYYEHLVVNKTVSLIGENKHNTIIDGNSTGTVINVTANDVKISGFTVQNSGGPGTGQGIYVFCSNNSVISGNNIEDNWVGVCLNYSYGARVSGNNITNNNYGIYLGCLEVPTPYYEVIANVSWVDDGDTIHVWIEDIVVELDPAGEVHENTYESVRFGGGVDAPELWDSQEGALEAMQFVQNLLPRETKVYLDLDDLAEDPDGRPYRGSRRRLIAVIYVELDGQWVNVNAELLRWGMEEYPDHNWLRYIGIPSEFDGREWLEEDYPYVLGFRNIIYENNLIGNTKQVYREESVNATMLLWDNGYPSGGNYWSDYNGTDADQDGIGDTPYTIDDNNQDNYPLMGMFSDFAVDWKDETYHVTTICNSTISAFNFNETSRLISFNVTGEDGIGFCRVSIPTTLAQDLWEGNYTVLVDGQPPLLMKNWTQGKYTYLYFTYQHSNHEVAIIPEFPATMILPIFIIVTLITVISRKWYLKKPKR